MDSFLPQHFVTCLMRLFIPSNNDYYLMQYLLKLTLKILTRFRMQNNVLIFALILLIRLHEKNPQLKGNRGSARRLVIISILLAKKCCFDEAIDNKHWVLAFSTYSVEKINRLEREFLHYIQYNLAITSADYYRLYENILTIFMRSKPFVYDIAQKVGFQIESGQCFSEVSLPFRLSK